MKLIKKLLTCCPLLCLPAAAFAQKTTMSGPVISAKDGSAVRGAVVRLAPARNTMQVRGAITDAGGHFFIKSNKTGTCQIKISYVGFGVLKQQSVQNGQSKDVGTNRLTPLSTSLSGVTVAGQQIPVEQNAQIADFLILNITNKQLKSTS